MHRRGRSGTSRTVRGMRECVERDRECERVCVRVCMCVYVCAEGRHATGNGRSAGQWSVGKTVILVTKWATITRPRRSKARPLPALTLLPSPAPSEAPGISPATSMSFTGMNRPRSPSHHPYLGAHCAVLPWVR